MSNLQLISVIMPVLNGERFIEVAIQSILNQSDVSLELIIVNDGSTDATQEIVNRLGQEHPNIKMIEGPKSGVANARNAGLSAINKKSAYIGFLDADDVYPQGRLYRQTKYLAQNPSLQWVNGLMQIFEDLDERTLRPVPGSRHMTIRGIQLGSCLFRREVFERLEGFEINMGHGEDTDFFLRLLESEMPYFSDDDIAVLYRRHDCNMTNEINATRRGFMLALKRSIERRKLSGKSFSLGSLFRLRIEAEDKFHDFV